MRKWILSVLLVAGLLVLPAGIAVADNGPHQGNFNNTTDACAGCHRAHRGSAKKLLKETSQQALCFSCHGSSGTGADTNVEDGVYVNRGPSGGAYGTDGAGLRGGGFVNALMDPDMDGSPSSASVTSKHNVGEVGTIWGNGAINSTSDPGKSGVTLECGSCHNPHGISNGDAYRILRPKPRDSGASADVVVPDETTKNYTITYKNNGYRDATYLSDSIVSQWCSQCHTRYLADDKAATTDSGDAIFKYRHRTTSVSCFKCHVAHGTSAQMTGAYSSSVELPDGSTASSGTNDSRLLHVNNRGVCYQCHQAP